VPRKKWNAENRNTRVGDFVIVADPNAVQGTWHMGKVVQVFPREDDLVRSVQVKMAAGTYTHPITKICIIYPAEGYTD